MMYTATIGLSATLLFLIQPFSSKLLLPLFGGGASVWVTSMVFFQAGLLLGYGVTHLMISRFGIKVHLQWIAAMLLLSMVSLPIGVMTLDLDLNSVSSNLVMTLAVSVGLPYFILASTSPAIQYCIASDATTQNANPYVQYGVSNLGSLLGLLVFPFLLEPWFKQSEVSIIWTVAFVLYSLLLMATIVRYWRIQRLQQAPAMPIQNPIAAEATPTVTGIWLFLAAVPSALLVVTTHYLTLDIANLPLLWVAPLCLYLLTFIIAFLFPGVSKPSPIRTLVGLVGIGLLLASKWVPELDHKVMLSLVGLFLVCMIFHGDLERAKPHKLNLTGYYLQVAAGGCLGSILAAILAPVLFYSLFEFYVVVLVGVYYLIANGLSLRPGIVWLFRVAMVTSLAISYVVNESTLGSETIDRSRSFYSTYAVREDEAVRRLVVGTHIHGAQYVDPAKEHILLGYYHDDTVSHFLFAEMPLQTVGFVGLGIGAMVELGREGMQMDLYELDPEVVELASKYFTILDRSPASLNVIIGDGRLKWREQAGDTYDVMFLDAFSSGTIPTHLMTLEAVVELQHIVKPDGVIAYHVSNHHIDLLPVLYGIAAETGLDVLTHIGRPDVGNYRYPATWVLLSNNQALFAKLEANYSGWQPAPEETLVWTDDFSNIWSVLR